MDGISEALINRIARNYSLFLADFPVDLKPGHLEVPTQEQITLYEGLSSLHGLIRDIYDHFPEFMSMDHHRDDREYICKAIEGAVKMLWALGTTGQLIQDPGGLELRANHEKLATAIKKAGIKDAVTAFMILSKAGFILEFHDEEDQSCPGGYKRCSTVVVRHSYQNEALLQAIPYYAARLPINKATKKGTIFEFLLRADLRPLLPGYTFQIPHFPMDEVEVTRTFDPATLEIWHELASFMQIHHPEYRLFFRVPRIRHRGWVADYSLKENDYGAWSLFADEDGLSVRIVFKEKSVPQLLEHIPGFSPDFQESYLTSVHCKDCIRCGRHVFYTHGDHLHRLCRSPWYVSPSLGMEDLPDIERLVDLLLEVS